MLNEFGHAVPARIIEGVVHEACERVLATGTSPDDEHRLLQTCRISLRARMERGRG
jgi:hypothetical protein